MEITPEKILEVQDLTKIYGPGCPLCLAATGPDYDTNQCPHCGSVVACGQVSLELYPDEILGIVGESGSGKSTLVKLLFFDEEATSGAMHFRGKKFLSQNQAELPPDLSERVNGENLLTLSSFQKRRIKNALMGMVYQYPHLGLRLEVSAGGNIAERLITAAWRHVGNMRQRATHLFEKTEIPVQRLDESPENFSGGMQQRVQIAKALSNNPMFLFLDEVSTGLDLSVQARVLDLLRTLQREFHLSMVAVSHDLGVIRLLTARTMVMKDGRIVESGLTDQILEDPQHPYTQLLVNSQL
ncbi:MAG: ATP-binding cassette domain-containing protein [Desulfobaccales bacterium]|jgi:putative phosphonate transport system ATP-binding protein